MENGAVRMEVNVFMRNMCVMVISEHGSHTVMMDQMKIQQCAFSGIVQLGTGNARMSCAYGRDMYVMESMSAVTNQMRNRHSVISGTALMGPGNVKMDYNV